MGVVTGKGLLALVRERYGAARRDASRSPRWWSPTSARCAPSSPASRPACELLAGVSRYVSVPLAALGVSLLVLRGSLPPRRARPARAQRASSSPTSSRASSPIPTGAPTARGLVVPGMPLTRDAVLVAVATVGTTLAPWGLAFIQSYAVDKRLTVEDLRYERIDVIVGAVLTGVIGFFIVVACAATLHVSGITINDAGDAAGALEPLAGHLAATLFGLGFLGAALLAAAIVPLSTAYSVAEAFRRPGRHRRQLREAPLFYVAYGAMVVVAAAVVLIPGAPLVPILFLSQALNAVLLLVILPFMRRLARDPAVMGDHALGLAGSSTTGITLAVIAASVAALAVLSVT